MNPREQALKSQVRKAQALIAQFEDGTGRHNSNLLGTERDAGGRINLDTSAFDEAHRRYLRTIARQTYSYATAYAISRGCIDPDLEIWEELRVKPQDELEASLLERGLLGARAEDCEIGQIVRLETLTTTPVKWVMHAGLEFERTDFALRTPRPDSKFISRAFWKRIA